MADSTLIRARGKKKVETATLAGGCFWCLEAVFREVTGVLDVVSGYAGGATASPCYEEVCAGNTGYAEVVQLTYDPAVISYRDILGIFFSVHDPTTLNRQGADVGSQYRSAVFYHSEAQKTAAEQIIREITEEKVWPDPIVTEVTALTAFYPAEEYHQRYYEKHTTQAYCHAVINPKMAKFRQQFAARLKG